MKTTKLFLLFLVPLFGCAQFSTPEIFLELGGFYEDEFEPSVYVKVAAGAELFSYKFIAPEIDISYYGGGAEDEDFTFDGNGINYRSILHRNMSGFVWGFAPKLFYEDDSYRLVLIPKYNFGTIKGNGGFLDSEDLRIEKSASTKIHFWSFALGIEGDAWRNSPKIGIYLIYSGLNGGPALNQLDFEENGYPGQNYNTKALGLSFRLNYDFKRKNPKRVKTNASAHP